MQNEKIKNIIEKITPYLNSDGGNIELVKVEDNVVYVKLTGFVANIENYASIGEEIYAIVLNVDEQKKHLNLSIKNMNYHNNKEFNESILGFRPLYEKLEEWTNESLK